MFTWRSTCRRLFSLLNRQWKYNTAKYASNFSTTRLCQYWVLGSCVSWFCDYKRENLQWFTPVARGCMFIFNNSSRFMAVRLLAGIYSDRYTNKARLKLTYPDSFAAMKLVGICRLFFHLKCSCCCCFLIKWAASYKGHRVTKKGGWYRPAVASCGQPLKPVAFSRGTTSSSEKSSCSHPITAPCLHLRARTRSGWCSSGRQASERLRSATVSTIEEKQQLYPVIRTLSMFVTGLCATELHVIWYMHCTRLFIF